MFFVPKFKRRVDEISKKSEEIYKNQYEGINKAILAFGNNLDFSNAKIGDIKELLKDNNLIETLIGKNATEEDKRNYIERKQADIDVVNGLRTDRIIYRRVVDKLTKQLVNAGLKPCTDYFKESDYRRS